MAVCSVCAPFALPPAASWRRWLTAKPLTAASARTHTDQSCLCCCLFLAAYLFAARASPTRLFTLQQHPRSGICAVASAQRHLCTVKLLHPALRSLLLLPQDSFHLFTITAPRRVQNVRLPRAELPSCCSSSRGRPTGNGRQRASERRRQTE